MEKYEEAIKCCDKAIKLDKKWKSPWNDKGVCFYYLDKNEEAIKYYDKAISLDKKWPTPCGNKAVTLYKLEKYHEALICCKKAIKLGSTDKEVLDCFEKIKKMNPKQPTKKQTQPRTDPKGSAGNDFFI